MTISRLLFLLFLLFPFAVQAQMRGQVERLAGGSGGITISINSVSADTAMGSTASTNYVYLVTGSHTLTLPTAVSNTNLNTVKNVGTVTMATTSSQTMDNSASGTVTLIPNQSLTFISNNSDWTIN